MYDNIGGKLKILAKAVFALEVLASFICGMVLMSSGYTEVILSGLLIWVIGPLVGWISSWFLYGFGELIEKTCEIAENTRSIFKAEERKKQIKRSRIDLVEKLRTYSLIDANEYSDIVNRITKDNSEYEQPDIDMVKSLSEVHDDYNNGVITLDEYNAKRSKLLNML